MCLEERHAKSERVVKVLTDEEKEGLKVACKLGRECLDEAAKVTFLTLALFLFKDCQLYK